MMEHPFPVDGYFGTQRDQHDLGQNWGRHPESVGLRRGEANQNNFVFGNGGGGAGAMGQTGLSPFSAEYPQSVPSVRL